MFKKLIIFSLCFVVFPLLVVSANAETKSDGLIINVSYTYVMGTHRAEGTSGKCTSNGVTHLYNYPGITYQYYDVYNSGAKAYASVRAKNASESSYHNDHSVIEF